MDDDYRDKRITDTDDDAVQAARRGLNRSLIACGVCHWCESVLDTGRVFCSTECCRSYEDERKRRRDLGL